MMKSILYLMWIGVASQTINDDHVKDGAQK